MLTRSLFALIMEIPLRIFLSCPTSNRSGEKVFFDIKNGRSSHHGYFPILERDNGDGRIGF